MATEQPTLMERVKARKAELLAGGVTVVATVGTASAASFDINATVGPLLDGVVALMPSIIALIIAVAPAIIVLAILGFIVGFLDEILGMLKLR